MRESKTALCIVLILMSYSPVFLFSQHQVITSRGDTLNCSHVETDLEMERVDCHIFSTDSIAVFNPDNIISIKYHYYPKYPSATIPQMVLEAGIGYSYGNYEQTLGNSPTRLFADQMKNGTHIVVGVQYHKHRQIGIATQCRNTWFSHDIDSMRATDRFNTFGVGAAYCSKAISNELFTTSQILITYSYYTTQGRFSSNSFYKSSHIFGLNISGAINYHISENLTLKFSGNMNIFNKIPTDNTISLAIGTIELSMGFAWIFY